MAFGRRLRSEPLVLSVVCSIACAVLFFSAALVHLSHKYPNESLRRGIGRYQASGACKRIVGSKVPSTVARNMIPSSPFHGHQKSKTELTRRKPSFDRDNRRVIYVEAEDFKASSGEGSMGGTPPPEDIFDSPKEEDELPSDLRQATDQAAEALNAAYERGETFQRVGLLIEEMVRGAKQNTDLQEPRVLSRVGAAFAAKANFQKTKYLFANVGSSMQHKKWLEEKDPERVSVSSLDRPQAIDGSEDLIVMIQPDLFSLKNVRILVDKIEGMPFENRPAVIMLNENFGDQEDKGEGFLNVPQLETTQARRLKTKFVVTYFLEQVLSRQAGIIVLFKKYPKPWKLFVADDGAYKLVQTTLREPSDEEIYDSVATFNRNKQGRRLWRSFRWRKQVEGLLDNFGIPKPFEDKVNRF